MTEIVFEKLSKSKPKKLASLKTRATLKTAGEKTTSPASRKNPKKAKSVTIPWKVITGVDGTRLTVHTVNADSRSFGDDLSRAFEKSVTKARKHNREVMGISWRGSSKD
jgi:hypothetical protein